jgi:hypothetical protein
MRGDLGGFKLGFAGAAGRKGVKCKGQSRLHLLVNKLHAMDFRKKEILFATPDCFAR